MSLDQAASPPSPTWRRVCRYAAFGGAAAVVLLFYAWATSPGTGLFDRLSDGNDYYNMLIRGFRAGHLSLPTEVPAALAHLKDPYDPKQNGPVGGMHDVSMYKGKYYIYFGVAPALVAYWPFAALFGHYLGDGQVTFLFCAVGFLAGTWILMRVRRAYFPTVGVPAEVAGIIAMGLATMVPVLLRRIQIYEVAISSAHAFFMLSLLGLFQTFHGKRKLAWLSAASVAYGMAIASRPSYLFGGVILLLPLLAGEGAFRPFFSGEAPGRLSRACAALIPVGLVMAGLLLYNALRFDSPFEFGQRYELSGFNETKATHFSLSYLWFNCRAYLFAPAQLSAYFPFVRVVSLPASPYRHMGIEDPFGIFPNIPFVLLALFSPLACVNRPRLRLFAVSVALSSFAVAAVIFTFQFASNRYMVDFLPGFIVLSVIGFWALDEQLGGLMRKLAIGAGCAALAWSVFFNVFASFNHNELLRVENPAVFRRLLHAFDTPRFLVDKARGKTFGPLELTVKFPTDKRGRLEPLVIAGTEFLSDYLYVLYIADDKIVVGFEHTGYGGPVSELIPIDYKRTHVIAVDMPPLYPPMGDPYFDGIPKLRTEVFNTHLTVSLDGAPIFDTAQQFYPAFHIRPLIGQSGSNQGALGRRFTGEIEGVRYLERDWNAPRGASQVGPIVITLVFPEQRTGTHEPLISSGSAGRGDVLVVNYLDSNHVTFSLDHWGYGGPTSGPVEIKPGTRQTLEVRFGSFFPLSEKPVGVGSAQWSDAAAKLSVFLDGRSVFEVKTPFYDVPFETIAVGRNTIGATSSIAQFGGRIVEFHRTELH
jgi:hypothetical protein